MMMREVFAPSAPSQLKENDACPPWCRHGWKWSLMKIESKPTVSVRQEKSSNSPVRTSELLRRRLVAKLQQALSPSARRTHPAQHYPRTSTSSTQCSVGSVWPATLSQGVSKPCSWHERNESKSTSDSPSSWIAALIVKRLSRSPLRCPRTARDLSHAVNAAVMTPSSQDATTLLRPTPRPNASRLVASMCHTNEGEVHRVPRTASINGAGLAPR
jgi:hypothetical protein